MRFPISAGHLISTFFPICWAILQVIVGRLTLPSGSCNLHSPGIPDPWAKPAQTNQQMATARRFPRRVLTSSTNFVDNRLPSHHGLA